MHLPISDEQIKHAKEFWEPRYGRELTSEEAREIIQNLIGFFEILIQADRRQKETDRNADSVEHS